MHCVNAYYRVYSCLPDGSFASLLCAYYAVALCSVGLDWLMAYA